MTSLASQLQRLSVPYTQTVWTTDKRRASLLFDPKEAANLDRQAVYAIGISGLEELEGLDPVFTDYQNSLFNLSSQSWERALHTSEVNQRLDETLDRFLVQLSPYFLLKCAHKALEWLVYRYHIHQMNMPALLRCIFPYHEAKIFVRVVQLLPIDKETHEWNWIHSAGKTGAPLTRATIINHCRADPAFLAFICDLLPTFTKVLGAESPNLRAVVGLWTCTVLGVTEDRTYVNEKIMSVLVPALVRGLKSKCVDYKAAAYMVLSQLSTHSTLQADVVTSMIQVLTKYISPKLTREALMCLALVIKTQRVQDLPKKSFKKVCRVPALVPLLAVLADRYDVTGLLGCVLRRLLPAALKVTTSLTPLTSSSAASDDEFGHSGALQYDSLFASVLSEVTMETNMATQLAKQLLEELVLAVEGGRDEDEWRTAAKAYLSVLQARYAVSVDLAVEVLVGGANKQVSPTSLQTVLQAAVGGAKGRLIDGSTSLLLALNHAHGPTRALAVDHLGQVVREEGPGLGGVGAQVGEMLLQRLEDDEVAVVKAVLDMGEMLPTVVPKDGLSEALLKLIDRRHTQSKWSPVVQQAVCLLCGAGLTAVTPHLGVRLLPYLLVNQTDQTHLATPLAILKSPAASSDPVLKSFAKAWLAEAQKKPGKKDMLAAGLNQHVVKGSASAVCTAGDKERQQLLTSVCDKAQTDARSGLVAVCVLSLALGLPGTKPAVASEIASHLLRVVAPRLRALTQATEFNTDSDMTDWVRALRPDDVTVASGALLWAMRALVAFLDRNEAKLPHSTWWTFDDPLVAVLVETLDLLVCVSCNHSNQKGGDMGPWHDLVRRLTQETLSDAALARLAALLWTVHLSPAPHPVSPLLQVASTHLVGRAWRAAGQGEVVSGRDQLTSILESTAYPVLAGLLVCLGSTEEAMRTGAVLCIKVARKTGAKDVGTCTKLFKKVFKQQEEITADATHIQNILWRVLKDDPELTDLVAHWAVDPHTPPLIRERLLHHLQITPNACILDKLLPMGTDILKKFEEDHNSVTPTHIDMWRHLVERFSTEDAGTLTVGSQRLGLLLNGLKAGVRGAKGTDSPAAVVMKHLTREFFNALPSAVEQREILSAILDNGEKPLNPDVANQARRLLQQLRLEWAHIQHEVSRDQVPATPVTVKSRRRSRIVPNVTEVAVPWKRLTFLLESLQSRKTMAESELCVGALFTLLTKLQQEEGEEWEYRQRLLLAVVHNLTDRWQQQQLAPKQESVNVEALVQAVRNPKTSIQTKQSALAVMANLAFYFPEHLLHHVMSIFTFVGTGLLAADDEHSLKMVSRTITTIVPSLLGARQNTAKETDHLVNQIVQVFVDAQRAIPRHRALAVFTTLVSTLGPHTALWRVLTLLLTTATHHRDNDPTAPSTPTTEAAPETVSGSLELDLEFGISVCEQFDVAATVQTATQVVRFLQWLAEQHEQPAKGHAKGAKPKKKSKSETQSIVDVSTLSGHQLRLLQFHLTRLLTRLLSTEALITQVVQGDSVTGETFQQFVQEAVIYMLAVARTHNTLISTPQAKFWKAMMAKAYEVIDKVLYLLPTHVLLEVVSGLLKLDLHGVRRKALELLASKLQALLVAPPTSEQQLPLLEIVDTLLAMATAPNTAKDTDVTATQQMALFNLKLLCKILGEKHQARFVQVLKSVMLLVGPAEATDVPSAVVGSALLLEAEVVAVVRAHAIPHLPKLVTPLLGLLSDKDFIGDHELVLTCGLTALHRLVCTLPHFLSPYLRDILIVVCQLNTLVPDSDKKSQAALRLTAIRHQVATVIAPRVLIPALGDTFTEVLATKQVSQMSLTCVMGVAREHVRSLSKEDLTAQHTPLLDLFCAALDLRRAHTKLSAKSVCAVEAAVIEAVLAMVVRLSEASFRPMFYKLYDWGCREDSPETRLRKLSFFRLADSLAAKLRSLFNLFVGHTLQAACNLLVSNNSLNGAVTYFGSGAAADRLSCQLVGHILDCLTKCMTHDTEGIFTGDVFNMLLQPLVDQMENVLGTEADYEARMSSHVVPCLSHLMVAAREDAHQKALNYQILLKARHVSPKVRFTALRVIAGAAVQMGDEYVLLLPEAIPFLAELMEDECEEVERECQNVIGQLEEVLGESLQKYF